ncbi:MAG: peptidase S10 [Pirellulaceae bacterium]|nr:peptidase S10 [Pirellulaceae bacterium]
MNVRYRLIRPLSLALLLGTCCLLAAVDRLAADDKQPAEGQRAETKAKDAEPEQLVVTQHSAVIGGQEVKYSATAGKLEMKTDAGQTKARMFFVAYTVDTDQPAARPLTFCFNGGPGSSSVWLHLGMLGPQRIRMPDDATPLKPPYQLQANPHSLLDQTDLVFIDPVSTGYSRPENEKEKSEFHGYDEDLRSVGQFIHDYTTRFQRWPSAKFLIGESYGGVRAAGLAGQLQQRYNLELNGIVIVSGVIDFQTLRFGAGNDLPYILFLPTYTATAWYHRALPADLQQQPLREVVQQAEQFAAGEYAHALLRDASLPAADRRAVAEKYSRLTGLGRAYVEGANLRVSMGRFGKELLRKRQRTVGRFDSRYLGMDRDNVGETYEYDASGAAIFGPFTATLNDYMRRQLKFEEPRVYEILTGNVQPWSYSRFENRYLNASDTLRQAMTANPYLKVFAACGYYDLATPHFAMDYTLDHLGLAPPLRGNLTVRYYEGGHMMYIHEPSLEQLRKDLVKFYGEAR